MKTTKTATSHHGSQEKSISRRQQLCLNFSENSKTKLPAWVYTYVLGVAPRINTSERLVSWPVLTLRVKKTNIFKCRPHNYAKKECISSLVNPSIQFQCHYSKLQFQVQQVCTHFLSKSTAYKFSSVREREPCP